MVDAAPLKSYLRKLEEKLATRDATEHTHRSSLEELIEALGEDIVAINEPKRIECGAPDLAVLRDRFIVGHVEAKDVGTPLDVTEPSEQLKRYRNSLPNLILTDYLEFRWYVDGDHRRTVRLGHLGADDKIKLDKAGKQNAAALLCDFLAHESEPIGTPRELAKRMARLTHLIRDIIITAFEKGKASDLLTDWRKAFAEVLVAELDEPENVGQFADMFAQTLAYGLFSARIRHGAGRFTRRRAQDLIPKTNPFLRDFFYYITGPRLDDEPYAGLVEDLVQLLALAEMDEILADFGKRTRQEDPTVHFYETFLAAYDPELRDRRGVRYTPNPVVSYIVRSVDLLLKDKFGLAGGLADTTRLSDGTHKLLVLDPACGTATFLYTVIDLIRQDFISADNAGMWSGYVREHLLPRIFGFELLMAPYAVAHFKLALQLSGHDLPKPQQPTWAYDFKSGERINVYLTNTLDRTVEESPRLIGPTKIVTDEAKAANELKQDKPIMVVIGNPPYSVSSANKGEHIEALMDRYKEGVRDERNIQPLSDDYIKFIRFAHDRVERTGYGVVGMITNHSYLFGLIHRGMRRALMDDFEEIYVLNLHGNALMREHPPGGGEDKNVFDIKQGVAIVFMVKAGRASGLADVHYADLWGTRETKYQRLNQDDATTTTWETLRPVAPHYFFVPKDFDLLEEYQQAWKVDDAVVLQTNGIKTHRDSFVIGYTREELRERVAAVREKSLSNETLQKRSGLSDSSTWNLEEARRGLQRDSDWEEAFRRVLYRPFDIRWIYYSDDFVERSRRDVMYHLQRENTALLCKRQTKRSPFSYAYISEKMAESCVFESAYANISAFPLYVYPKNGSETLFDSTATSPWPPDPSHGNRVPNLLQGFVEDFEGKLGISFDPHKTDNAPRETFGPRDVLGYTYAIFHSPAYRERYAEFLKIDFPRVPLTSDVDLFWRLVELGKELIDLHLVEHPKLSTLVTSYPVPGDDRVKRRGGFPKLISAGESRTKTGEVADKNRVYINLKQYFRGVPKDAWEFQVGGYQVLHKWLKDRKGRELSYEEKIHWQKIVVALKETMRLMDEIDETIPQWPID